MKRSKNGTHVLLLLLWKSTWTDTLDSYRNYGREILIMNAHTRLFHFYCHSGVHMYVQLKCVPPNAMTLFIDDDVFACQIFFFFHLYNLYSVFHSLITDFLFNCFLYSFSFFFFYHFLFNFCICFVLFSLLFYNLFFFFHTKIHLHLKRWCELAVRN